MHIYLHRSYFFLALFLICSIKAVAQQDSVVKDVPKVPPGYTYLDDFNQYPDSFKTIDTSLDEMQLYDLGYLRNLGKPATPIFPLTWKQEQDMGFRFGFDQWDEYRFKVSNQKFYNTRSPYTDFKFIQGGTLVQSFDAVHSQNIKPYWNASAHYKRLSYGGPATIFSSTASNVGVNTWYYSPSRRYLGIAAVAVNTFKGQESGGVVNDSDVIALPASRKSGAAVQLPDARQRWTDKHFMAQQYLYLGKSEQYTPSDTDSVAIKLLEPRFFLGHRIGYYENRYVYEDTVLNEFFYPELYNDLLLTRDYYWYNNWTNEFSFGRLRRPFQLLDSTPVYARAFGRVEMLRVRENEYVENLQNLILGGEAEKGGKIGVGAKASYTLAGWNSGDYKAEAEVRAPFLSMIHLPILSIKALSQQYEPAYNTQFLTANSFRWDTDLMKVNINGLSVSFYDTASVFNIETFYGRMDNLVYYDQFASVNQFNGGTNYLRLSLIKDIKVFKFHLKNYLVYQKVSNDLLRFPEVLYRGSLYYESYIFKKALLGRIGADVASNTPYFSYSYMPGIAEFYLQNAIQTGNYPVFDVWVTAKVKTFQFMVKMEHVNLGLTGDEYFILPHYPYPSRGLRVGVKWTFYN